MAFRSPGGRVAALALSLTAAAAAGCGTSVAQHDTRYTQQLQSFQQRFNASVHDVMAVSPRRGRAATADAVGRFEQGIAQVELSLRGIRAPATVSPLHRRLIATIDRYGAEVRRMVTSLRATDRTTLVTSGHRFRTATLQLRRQVQATLTQIGSTLRRESGAVSP